MKWTVRFVVFRCSSFSHCHVLWYDIAELQRTQSEQVLKALQNHPDAWTRVDSILETTQNNQTKFYALSILESVITTRWGALPEEQREGIKTYVSNLIIKISTDEASFRSQKVFLGKLNLVLVDVLKQDWPHRWPSFIPDIVGASKTNEGLCENSMAILRLLSEEVFDFSKNSLTVRGHSPTCLHRLRCLRCLLLWCPPLFSRLVMRPTTILPIEQQAKTKEMKGSFNEQFAAVHELCLMVLNASTKPDLIKATLSTLNSFLGWVPLGYILESNMVDILLSLMSKEAYRNTAIQCLTEVGMLEVGAEHDAKFVGMYSIFMRQLLAMLPPGTNIPQAYANGSDADQAFVQNLALFFTSFFRSHISALERKDTPNADETRRSLLQGLDILVQISYVEDDEVLKICLDYWNFFVPDVYSSLAQEPNAAFVPFGSDAGKYDKAGRLGRKAFFEDISSRLRAMIIARMAKPEEVIVVEDENGNVVRETMKDTDVLARYKTMHETLVYLCHLDHEDTEKQMLESLRLQINSRGNAFGSGANGAMASTDQRGSEGWGALNRLCWAIGSVSGSMLEEQENRFLVTVIRDLLNLCEITRGKDNKAVIASNIMYVVGQYPRFLRNHWKFLKTVVNKQFEFMHEPHPGVQDMACETFLKIVTKCRKKFVGLQVGESQPFVCELLDNLTSTIKDLELHQIHMFYEAVGIMIAAEPDINKQELYLSRLMKPANDFWQVMLQQAFVNSEFLKETQAVKDIQHYLQTNVSVCSSLGSPFVFQLDKIFVEMLQLYKMYSELISTSIATGGPHAAKSSVVKAMRSVKKVTLRLIETFVAKTNDVDTFVQKHIPAMMDPILGDYTRNVPDARDAEVLSLFAAMIDRIREKMEHEVPKIFEAVFECTLDMITKNMEDYPEHRLRFFGLLRAVTKHCPRTLFAMSEGQLKLIIDSVIWAFRHTERNIAETGLRLLYEMLHTFRSSEAASAFYKAYYLQLLTEVFAVLTDTFHKPGFTLQAHILHHLFSVVQSDVIKVPLWEDSLGPSAFPTNAVYIQQRVSDMLSTSFPNLLPQQVQAAVVGMMELKEIGSFKQHLRDFLVQSNKFMDQNNADLYAEEVQAAKQAEIERMTHIPGLLDVKLEDEDDD